uniref:Uncharacterized protein n=1 Tax=Octopus bimaculoides TaxID=37653 RepID=A0A0L8IAI3_OCTBM
MAGRKEEVCDETRRDFVKSFNEDFSLLGKMKSMRKRMMNYHSVLCESQP